MTLTYFVIAIIITTEVSVSGSEIIQSVYYALGVNFFEQLHVFRNSDNVSLECLTDLKIVGEALKDNENWALRSMYICEFDRKSLLNYILHTNIFSA